MTTGPFLARVRALLLTSTIAATLLAGGVSVGAQPAQAADGARIAIGDSVMLGARSQLRKNGFAVDASTSRQSYVGPSLLRKRGSALPRNVVVHLGTNGTFPLDTCKAIVRRAGAGRHVYLVTVHAKRSWVKGNNRVIRACDKAFPSSRVSVIDWDWAASRHRDWLYSDGIHLTGKGQRNYARLIDEAVDGRRT